MIIRYFADIRSLTGCKEETWTKAAPTLRALLCGLAAKYGAVFERKILENGQLSQTIIILVNGRHVEYLARLDTPLDPSDVVAVFPMVAGG